MQPSHKFILSILLGLLIGTAQASDALLPPIFDSHSHYSPEDAERFSPMQIKQIMESNNVIGAVITSTPALQTEKLHQSLPKMIVPFLGVYSSKKIKPLWMHRLDTINLANEKLNRYAYQGIGELHIFKQDTFSPILKRIVQTATERNLILMIHGDASVIDEVFRISPTAKIIWAHLGTNPSPTFLTAVLKRHPKSLFIDTSVRDKLFVDNNKQLKPEWRAFFEKNQNQILAAIDTYSTQRWENYADAVKHIRLWLTQLTPDARDKIAYRNAQKLFNRHNKATNP